MIAKDSYIIAVEKSDSNYEDVLNAINTRPTAPDGYGYRLREDLTWELYELPVTAEDADPELLAEEALKIIMGGAV